MTEKGLKMGRLSRVLVILLYFSLFLQLLMPSSALADKGMVAPLGISLYEPGQKAIIAWNGEEEILLLSTDVHASQETKVLEILPLPSQPEKIEKGNFKSFVRIHELIQKRYPWLYKELGPTKGGEGGGVEIIFHEKIGAHDLTVVKVDSAEDLVKWAEDFLRRNEVEFQISSPRLEELVEAYIKEGIKFYVFDLIEISPAQKSVEPILYQFKTDFAYYPLKISSIVSGYTSINLFLLTPESLDMGSLFWWGSRLGGLRVVYAYGEKEKPIHFELNREELESIDPRIAELLGERAWLTALEYQGPLSVLYEVYNGDLKLYKISQLPKILSEARELPQGSILECSPRPGYYYLGVVYYEPPIKIDGVATPVTLVKTRLRGLDGLYPAYLIVNEARDEVVIRVNGIPATIRNSIRIQDSQLYLGLPVKIMPPEVLPRLKPQEVLKMELKLNRVYETYGKGPHKQQRLVKIEPVYEVQGTARAKIFWLIPTHININTTLDAQTGEIIKEQKPWWRIFCHIPEKETYMG